MYSPYPVPNMDANMLHFVQQQQQKMSRHHMQSTYGASNAANPPASFMSPQMMMPHYGMGMGGSPLPMGPHGHQASLVAARTPNHHAFNGSTNGSTCTPGRTVAAGQQMWSGNSAHQPMSATHHNHLSSVKPVALFHAANGATHSPAPSSMGGSQRTPPSQQSKVVPAAHADACLKSMHVTLGDKVNPISGRTLERDLNLATKEELVQVLLDLSSCNQDAASFIRTKSQLFALRENCCISSSQMPEHDVPMVPSITPSKFQLHADLQHVALPSAAPATSSAAYRAGKSPIRDELHQSLAERHSTPETRAFCVDVHPCLRLYGACRHSTNCIFKTLPRNLCLNWVRGSCTGGSECGCVHRFPPNCPIQVEMVFELARGGDRSGMSKRAQTLATIAAAKAVVTTSAGRREEGVDDGEMNGADQQPASVEDLLSGAPVTERVLFDDPEVDASMCSTVTSEDANDSGSSSIAHDALTTPVKTLPPAPRVIPAEQSEPSDDLHVARCLDDSFENAAC